MTFGELKRLLRKNGCYISEQEKKHECWHSPKTGKSFRVGRHNTQEVKSGTLKNIIDASGINI